MTSRAEDTQSRGADDEPIPKSFSKQSGAKAMAGVPAARWWVEEPLDYTWHDAHPQVLLAGEGHSLEKELRGETAWQKPRTACDGKATGKGRGGSQPRTQGH